MEQMYKAFEQKYMGYTYNKIELSNEPPLYVEKV